MKLKNWFIKQLKKKSRIYIMPTKMGWYLNGLIFLMFLLSFGYSNNLLLIFTLMLFALNLIWLIQTHFHLHALKLGQVLILDAHANELTSAEISWKNCPENTILNWKLKVETESDSILIKTIKDTKESTIGHIKITKRGVWNFLYIKISTDLPFGLYHVWIYLPLSVTTYIYPSLLKDVPSFEDLKYQNEGEILTLHEGQEEFLNLSSYQGEESRKISWKHYAKSGDVLVKQGQSTKDSLIHFHLPNKLQKDEIYLSILATQMSFCFKNQIAFSLEVNDKKIGPGLSDKHLKDCLTELAKC